MNVFDEYERFYIIPAKPISVNDAYASTHGAGRDRYLTNEGAQYKKRIKEYLEIQDNNFYNEVKFSIDFHNNYYMKSFYYFFFSDNAYYAGNGPYNFESGILAHDCSNFVKLIEDALSEYIGINDKFFNEVKTAKNLSKHLNPRLSEDCYILIFLGKTEYLKPILLSDSNQIIQRIDCLHTIKQFFNPY